MLRRAFFARMAGGLAAITTMAKSALAMRPAEEPMPEAPVEDTKPTEEALQKIQKIHTSVISLMGHMWDESPDIVHDAVLQWFLDEAAKQGYDIPLSFPADRMFCPDHPRTDAEHQALFDRFQKVPKGVQAWSIFERMTLEEQSALFRWDRRENSGLWSLYGCGLPGSYSRMYSMMTVMGVPILKHDLKLAGLTKVSPYWIWWSRFTEEYAKLGKAVETALPVKDEPLPAMKCLYSVNGPGGRHEKEITIEFGIGRLPDTPPDM